ncbi:FtsH protease activity modulator HflK [Phenylobacterium sp.]|uniref:FtsH protease activity modulator HflK n=1 Tax=Phenylobacterium sp. TaxID=1871053 RepID=UPI00272FD535|nr:FtsH protease activity modulator HflK [Phenylobacterium sp.]MDP1597650.1 FtsH protease activity modulator HflK [Phenylobacterium sp.]MDP3591047.1 FtsH protease activity modulator HflK [Phenylobacterium sp.]
MPWNDNANPGPWGAPPPNDGNGDKKPPPRRPTGGGGGNGPRGPRRPEGPELNAAFERLQQQVRDFFGGPGGDGIRPGAIAAVAGVGFGLWALSGIYIVQPNEQAVVTTFGAYSRSEGPGIRYHLPIPLERVEKVPVTSLNRIDIGGTATNDVPAESLMLTGDENIVDLDFSVTWRVANARNFVFNVRDQDSAVKAVAESAMREVVGRTPLQDVLTRGRGQVQAQAAETMQRTLDSWNAGVTVVEVQIRTANPPTEVVAAFRDVTNAQQDAESAANEANTYRNRVINEAKGDAAKLIESARGYREQSVREATGDVSRFDQIYNEYRKAPGVTKERLYIETMQRVLQNSNKVVIDGKGASAPIILPPDVFRPRTAALSAVRVEPQPETGAAPTPSTGAAR